MQGQMPKGVIGQLGPTRFTGPQQAGDFRVVAGGRSYPVVRMYASGFALSAEDAPQLRGLVELYREQEHVLMCLVVANAPEDGEIRYEFKRATPVTEQRPLDFVAHGEGIPDIPHQDGLAL